MKTTTQSEAPVSPSRERGGSRERSGSRRRYSRALLVALAGAFWGGVACSDDGDEDDGAACMGGGGPVTGVADTHCAVAQDIGECVTGAAAAALGEEPAEEEFVVRYGNEADDDDCKYRVRFENTCIRLNEPVTFTTTFTRKADRDPATGAIPNSPEIYLADDDGHISPSNNITATEGPPGTYKIGPVVFDRSGRWVVRFHFFETCSDIPEDSPHGHIGFYVDVP